MRIQLCIIGASLSEPNTSGTLLQYTESLPLERLYQLLTLVCTVLGDMRCLVSMAACKCNVVVSSKFVGAYLNNLLSTKVLRLYSFKQRAELYLLVYVELCVPFQGLSGVFHKVSAAHLVCV